MSEPRRQDRIRTFLKAQIQFNKGASKIDCVVKNISPTGARIDLTSAVGLPAEFDLVIPHREKTYRATLVWRTEGTLGVRFLNIDSEAPPPPAPERPALSLEKENERLRARIVELTKRLEALGQDISSDGRF